jgi:hypothetical protein
MDCDLLIDTSACDGWDEFTPADQERGTLMAWETLRYLSGFRLGNCPVTLRPCRQDCDRWPTYQAYPSTGRSNWAGAEGGMRPTIVDGQWYNLTCGCGVGNCSCTHVCEVRLIGEVASIDEVKQDGVTIDPTAYRVDNGNLLVRTDGECWPLCQDMTKPLTEDGTFGVTYTPGVATDAWISAAAGALACEYAKVTSGSGKCRLPSNVTRIVRQGVTLDLAQNPFPSGMTGLREVDVLIARYNPNHLPSPSVVYSPDVRHGRVTKWSSP